jgi:hypothetical protein
MEYSKLVAVAGLPGLFELISSKSDGAVVRSLEDQSTKFVSSRIHSFSQLESIEVFTVADNVNLAEVLLAMQTEGGKLPDERDAVAVKKYFQKVYPDLDFERVYHSDLKKMIKWFEVLQKNKIEIVVPEFEEEEMVEEPEIKAEEEVKPKKTATKKAAAEKSAAKKEKEEPAKKKSSPKKK